ncbi:MULTISPECIES: hypothetical protein [Eikenella]|uniref:hypothetical protein n=1 Tax=Eikenella TaxID=538 RepID=UPI000A5EE876|nr:MULTISPECIES: hypothetical protein [Eikenella]
MADPGLPEISTTGFAKTPVPAELNSTAASPKGSRDCNSGRGKPKERRGGRMVLQRSSKQAASVGQVMPCQFQVALVRAAGRYQAHSYGVSGSLQDGGLQVIPSERFYPANLNEAT